ncbi:MAG: hypothetical protein A2289_17520 [Deltaproteobacteria bacterium RIFOXYA12_FULL_58_15]|nr:MAG: hypothetical protein A2289_17520 [Deltaproteobacteria bacterium RIFOXYA12_FULL_58_15]
MKDSENRRIEPEALALVEIDGLARAVRAQDAALKKAPIEILASAPMSPGKAALIFVGDVASVEESLAEVVSIVGSRLIDQMFLPGIHPKVVRALRGEKQQRNNEALAVVELNTMAAAIVSADMAVKTADVAVGRMHLATGFGGKGFFTLWGEQSEVEAAVEAALKIAGERVCDHEIIPAPHDELEDAVFVRPWPIDPADAKKNAE